MSGAEIEAMYRLLAIAKYDERYVIPAAYSKDAAALEAQAASTSDCSLDCAGGPGMTEPAVAEGFHLVADGDQVRSGRKSLSTRRSDGRLGLSIDPTGERP
jgi:nitrate reductase beta subunit